MAGGVQYLVKLQCHFWHDVGVLLLMPGGVFREVVPPFVTGAIFGEVGMMLECYFRGRGRFGEVAVCCSDAGVSLDVAGAVFCDIGYLFERSAHEICIFSYKMRLSSAKDNLGEQAGLWTGGCMVGSLNSDHFRMIR